MECKNARTLKRRKGRTLRQLSRGQQAEPVLSDADVRGIRRSELSDQDALD